MNDITEENITELAAARWATAHRPRLARVLPELIRHLHDFARDVELTEAEWKTALQWLRRTVEFSDDKRDELTLAADVLGLSMLLVELNHRRDSTATPATVLGPFHIQGSPELEFGADMSAGVSGRPLFIEGVVRDSMTDAPIAGAVLDVWQADADGAYEAQLSVEGARLRGKYTSTSRGTYCVRTIAPRGYSIPMDGPVGELVSSTDISHCRPAHVHFLLHATGYEPLVTHLFEKDAPYLDSDVVFGTKPELVVEFEPREPGPTPDGRASATPWLLARYDFIVQPQA